MCSDPRQYRRRSLRLKGYDYAQRGVYFVTICTWHLRCLFGEIVKRRMRLNEAGQIVLEEWLQTPRVRPEIELDAYVVMPNHVHGIIAIVSGRGRGVWPYAPTNEAALCSPSRTVGAVVRGFKSAVTKRLNELRGTPGAPVWQRNFYEHVVRNGDDLDEIRRYIRENPTRWAEDDANPK